LPSSAKLQHPPRLEPVASLSPIRASSTRHKNGSWCRLENPGRPLLFGTTPSSSRRPGRPLTHHRRTAPAPIAAQPPSSGAAVWTACQRPLSHENNPPPASTKQLAHSATSESNRPAAASLLPPELRCLVVHLGVDPKATSQSAPILHRRLVATNLQLSATVPPLLGSCRPLELTPRLPALPSNAQCPGFLRKSLESASWDTASLFFPRRPSGAKVAAYRGIFAPLAISRRHRAPVLNKSARTASASRLLVTLLAQQPHGAHLLLCLVPLIGLSIRQSSWGLLPSAIPHSQRNPRSGCSGNNGSRSA
jgi:hypothetical protein